MASIDLFETAVAVPDRENFKCAGSDAILDILGFMEENVSPCLLKFEPILSVLILL